jgi:hypothetical protein
MKPDVEKLLEILSTYNLTNNYSYYRKVNMDDIRLELFIRYLQPYIDEINAECESYSTYAKFIKCQSYFHNRKERVCLVITYPQTLLYAFETTHLLDNINKFHEEFEEIKAKAIKMAKKIHETQEFNEKLLKDLTALLEKEDYISTPKHVKNYYRRSDYDCNTLKLKCGYHYKSFDLGIVELPMVEQLAEDKRDKFLRMSLNKFRKAFCIEMEYKLDNLNNINMCNKAEMVFVAEFAIKTKNFKLAKKLYKYKKYPEDIKLKLEGMAVAGRLMK